MRLLRCLVLTILLTACGVHNPTPDQALNSVTLPTPTDSATGLKLPPGYRAEILASGLNSPTHVALGPDGAYYLTQLNGGENDGKGQVVRIAKPGATPEVVLDNLTKPTGLTWAVGSLFIVAGNSVLVSHVKDDKFDTPSTLFKDLPFNGRSEGQIFTGPDGMLYFQSTGNENTLSGSGFIYTAKPDGSAMQVFARGLKNAYAMAWDTKTGKMYATEIGDGDIQGVGPFPDELNVIYRGGNYGWPLCYAYQEENHGIGGDRKYCADTDSSIALFPPHNTPTGLAVYDGKLIVALWNGSPPRLVSVVPGKSTVSEFASGFKLPIAFMTPPDGSLLVVDMGSGTLWRLTK